MDDLNVDRSGSASTGGVLDRPYAQATENSVRQQYQKPFATDHSNDVGNHGWISELPRSLG